MLRSIISLAMLIPVSASAAEYPLTYGKFSLHPSGWVEGDITNKQRADLEMCKSTAQSQAGQSADQKKIMAQIYGLKADSVDLYGSLLVGCLSDEKNGKGWVVLKTDGERPEPVTSRFASRSFMGLDPAK